MNDTNRKKPSAFGRFLFTAKDIASHSEADERRLAAERQIRVKVVFKRYILLLAAGFSYIFF